MNNLWTRRALNKVGLLEPLMKLKRKFAYIEQPFMPCTPHLLIAVNKSFRLLCEKGLGEGSDYLEFGIFRGFTLWYAQQIANDMGIRDMHFYGFDSFLGLPPLVDVDKEGGFREGAYFCSQWQVEAYLNQYGIDWKRTFLVPGWFEKTLNEVTQKKFGMRRCSLCVIDCDLYESSRFVLNFIEPLIHKDMIVLFDDWNSYEKDPNKGERRALREFLEQRSGIHATHLFEFGGHGQAFMLSRVR